MKMHIRESICNFGPRSRPMATCGITIGAANSNYATVASHSLLLRSFAWHRLAYSSRNGGPNLHSMFNEPASTCKHFDWKLCSEPPYWSY